MSITDGEGKVEVMGKQFVPPAWLKWGLALIIGGIGAFHVLPILLKLTLDLVTLGILIVIGLGIFYLLPAICEFLASFGYQMMSLAIKRDPVSRLRRDINEQRSFIDQLAAQITDAQGVIEATGEIFKKGQKSLSSEETQEFQTQFDAMVEAANAMTNLYEDKVAELQRFEREVNNAEAKNQIGEAFGYAMKAFQFSKKSGPTSDGARIAFAEIEQKLARSKAQLRLTLNQPMSPIILKPAEHKTAIPQGGN